MTKSIALILISICLTGCIVNPVTGERELGLVSSQQEIAIGQAQYAPAQQMQGGAYKTDAALSAYISRIGNKLAQSSGVDLPYEFVVLNNSVPNAWALPGGKIAINRGLLQALRNEGEVAAVLGHEIAHAAARHGAKRVERGYITQGAVLLAAIGSSGSDYAPYVVGAAQLGATLLNQKYSRNAERQADFYGTGFMAKAGYDPYAAITLQETFARLSGEGNSSWLQGLFASHPASMERVANNKMLVKQLRREGFTSGIYGQAEFEAAMSELMSAQPAYDAFDEAMSLYADDELEAAAGEIAKAIRLYGRESQFHGLRGSIRNKQARWADAITNFDRAIDRDSGYFAFYLSRGLAYAQLEEPTNAKQNLDHSIRLLPTATAYQALGKIAEARGDVSAAKVYYQQASQGQNNASTAARSSLVRLEVADQPAKYITARIRLNEHKEYVVEVTNRTAVALKNIVVRVELKMASVTKTSSVRITKLKAKSSYVGKLKVDGVVSGGRAYAVSAQFLGG
ncbi:MAG: M48 family metalloprotease [Gammaproteobacteria bacterium]|nr:M48 family metalloprotease [Gammaproteobacteria bacterium]